MYVRACLPARARVCVCVCVCVCVWCTRSDRFLVLSLSLSLSAGRYTKHSREMSQTPWVIDGVRKSEHSVEVMRAFQVL